MQKLGHRTIIETFDCPLTGLTIEMVRPGRRHKLRAMAVLESAWEGEAVDLLNPPTPKTGDTQLYFAYLELWQLALAAECIRIRDGENPIGFDRLDTLDSQVAHEWVARFLVFAGLLVETAPLEDKKKEPNSPS